MATTKTKTVKTVVDSQIEDFQWAARTVLRFVLSPSLRNVDDAQFGVDLLANYVRMGRERVLRGDGVVGPVRLFQD